jgi:hypothetical protein
MNIEALVISNAAVHNNSTRMAVFNVMIRPIIRPPKAHTLDAMGMDLLEFPKLNTGLQQVLHTGTFEVAA